MTTLRPVTLVLPYYENPRMLYAQFWRLKELPPDVRTALHLIVVDDGSPTRQQQASWVFSLATLPALASIVLYRINVDVRWNWIAARNIGAHHASTDWLLMTDVDHLVPERTWREVMTRRLTDNYAYKFTREDAVALEPHVRSTHNPKPHPNTWLMTRETFLGAGGYDERFSGHYGTDGEFRTRIEKYTGRNPVPVIHSPVIRVPRELIADASTTTYTRKDPVLDRGHVKRIIAARGRAKPLRLTFPYERVF